MIKRLRFMVASLCMGFFLAGWGIPAWSGECQVAPEKSGESRATVSEGDTAPDFTLPLTNHTTFHLYDYTGGIIFINIWADT